ncbi:MAG TPA: homoserine O-acetyltransferase [Phycisphaerae bacterium]|nr:homoserine O-acetyltransferase [Phycisphaerae bacterium]
MGTVGPESSDTVRSARLLKYARRLDLDQPLELERGGRLTEVTVAYETYGRLTPARDNAVLVCHALSGDSHVAMHDEADDPGWWDIAVGAGKPIDTDRYFVICPNVLGGCRGTTGPNSPNPATGRPYGPDFPTITVDDMVEVQRRLVDHLGIARLLAVVGGSMGGHQALLWPIRHPDRVRGAILVATSTRLSSQALAFDVVGRNAILHDPNFHGGRYADRGGSPDVGLAIARMIGHITYLSRESMKEKFGSHRTAARDVPVAFEKEFSVGSYLGHQGTKFVERFDANSYVTLSMAMDLFDLGESAWELMPHVQPTDCRWLVMSFTSDWLFPPAESREIVQALIATHKPVSYCNVRSRAGHDAFLLAEDVKVYGALMSGFLGALSGRPDCPPAVPHDRANGPTSIFSPEHPQRLDYERIIELIPPSASVLDLGCGGGGLLELLVARGHQRVMGVELDEQAVVASVQRGLDVVQGDLNEGLAAFADRQFDVVVLSQTLQSILDVEGLIGEMVRVGRRCIVSFPNFAYHKLRRVLHDAGRAPESAGQLRYKWYNSPNIRFFTIADFREFCREKGLRVHRCLCLDTEEGRDIAAGEDCNYQADVAIFILSR